MSTKSPSFRKIHIPTCQRTCVYRFILSTYSPSFHTATFRNPKSSSPSPLSPLFLPYLGVIPVQELGPPVFLPVEAPGPLIHEKIAPRPHLFDDIKADSLARDIESPDHPFHIADHFAAHDDRSGVAQRLPLIGIRAGYAAAFRVAVVAGVNAAEIGKTVLEHDEIGIEALDDVVQIGVVHIRRILIGTTIALPISIVDNLSITPNKFSSKSGYGNTGTNVRINFFNSQL